MVRRTAAQKRTSLFESSLFVKRSIEYIVLQGKIYLGYEYITLIAATPFVLQLNLVECSIEKRRTDVTVLKVRIFVSTPLQL